MGSIGADAVYQNAQTTYGFEYQLVPGRDDENGFNSFQIPGLDINRDNNLSDLRAELVLLSWFCTLSRTRENNDVSFDWAYHRLAIGYEPDRNIKIFKPERFMRDVKETIGVMVANLSPRLGCDHPCFPKHKSTPVSLMLSTHSHTIDHLDEQIRALYHSEDMLQYTVMKYINSFVDTVRLCISRPGSTVEQLMLPTESDFDQIWGWNHTRPPSYDVCMHDIISEQARKTPKMTAISSWDGGLTYEQIEQYSTTLAYRLHDIGVKLSDYVLVCFEKSCWTIVGILAVMKIGATFVLMDPTLPLARLQNMAHQVDGKAMVASRKQEALATSILPYGIKVIVEADTFLAGVLDIGVLPALAMVPTSTIMYIIFTSGSTGTPKGVMISHKTYTSSAIPRAEAVGYTESSRVLDFASYAFDVSIDSMLLTLSRGGCLCIPSDEDRMNDINGVIRKMAVNYAGITPSVARILDPDVIASLSCLGLGGEAATARDVNHWGKSTRIVIGYGPCECTIGCTINSSAATGRDYISIGKGNGAAIWITCPNDHEVLMPVGAVGELIVDGPIVGQGYLNDSAKTAASFIEDPPWLTSGHKQYNGRRGRLYKTGDLGKYDPDGSGGIIFVGRKDSQVKLRGQRVELGEIEYQLKLHLPPEMNVIVEVITPLGFSGQPTLIGFIASQSKSRSDEIELQRVSPEEGLRKALLGIDTTLANVLPRYMIPTAFIYVNFIPVLISGKTDRKRLREFGGTIDIRQLDENTPTDPLHQPLSEVEEHLAQAWSHVLKIDYKAIRTDDNFFVLGGDSVVAMKLVSHCTSQSISLTVANVFLHPTLSTMASTVRTLSIRTQTEVPPFSMLSSASESACAEASQSCKLEASAIEDIYPCTATQEALFTFSIKASKPYIAQRVARIPDHISTDDWKGAWESVIAASAILRSRLVQLQQPGLFQVVVQEKIQWRHRSDLNQYLEDDQKEAIGLGQSLVRYAIIDEPTNKNRYMVWTVHHVLYDGWSESLTLKMVHEALNGGSTDPGAQMRDFVNYVKATDEGAIQTFWQQELEGAVGNQFPELPFRDYLPTPDSVLEHQFSLEATKDNASPFTTASLIRGAWALVASQYMGSDDVVFGETLTGRDIQLVGVESIQGPLIATIPIRTHVDRSVSGQSYLQTVQQDMMARIPYQHYGMQNIRKVSPDALYACEARTGLVIQPEPEYEASELGFDKGDVVREALHFNPYPLMIAIGIRKCTIRVCASFDSSLIEVPQMRRILIQLEATCHSLNQGMSKPIGEISCIPTTELDQIWHWNQTPPMALDQPLPRLRAPGDIKAGSRYPPAIVSWVCDPRNPSLLSPIGCIGELWLEGALLPDNGVEAPNWLVAGSSTYAGRTGKLHATGDLVRLEGSGQLTFIGRKETVAPIRGHAVDLARLGSCIIKHLPDSARAAAAVVPLTLENDGSDPNDKLVIFIEHQSSEHSSEADIRTNYRVSESECFDVTVWGSIDFGLASALKDVHKAVRDTLPPSMVPYTYLAISKLPLGVGKFIPTLQNRLNLSIPPIVLTQLREHLEEAWAISSKSAVLTQAQNTVRASWATILGMEEEKIDVDDNFFRLGGDSVLAMRLVSNLRAQGYILSVADIFQNMRLRDTAAVLKEETSPKAIQAYEAFSTISHVNVKSLLEVIRPQLENADWSVQDLLPVTSSQALDIRATIQQPRTSVQYTMLFFNEEIDRDCLLHACDELVKSHEILRTVFAEHDSKFYQVVLQHLDVFIQTYRTDRDLEEYVKDHCMADSKSNFQLGSSFLRFIYVEGRDGCKCLVMGLSHAQYDGSSLPRLLRDLERLYIGNPLTEIKPFSAYIAQTRDSVLESKALSYWRNLLDCSSMSVLSGGSGQAADRSIFLETSVEVSQRPSNITVATLLAASWALTLARLLKVLDVLFGTITTGHNIDAGDIEGVMGPCYQFTPVRVPFQPEWTAGDLFGFVQGQIAESAAYDFIGFEKIFKQCTKWPSQSGFYNSIVHHQDFEDFDSMPFAGTSCNVDVLNPHGDASHPLKIASFVREGRTHVGIVGSEREPAFIQATLDQLIATIEELITLPTQDPLLERSEIREWSDVP
ncbi:uncharacterized protein A1O9_07228 [Exophiala aquamarina CBS 119918]|uniref:Carrier domain-containing protein n=1 Tax=Exophiala aquamarina CBS 119918 TaxID=1182545 RepID=A0A072PCK9_9EURO|nr:uncharacterized protein A1O9_07228 [Exophiala aquamarina CBS 119918]KEF57038.1 hypothetical protein A1O9_07228 [Exophiala aquamarina CBS 119918]